jgi:hypothetical protein
VVHPAAGVVAVAAALYLLERLVVVGDVFAEVLLN